ncbi:TadE/TadG family type IV pilus assembly protein [Devosia submarina]|uniref:TadE/TadG family type IV pilus assembly protein n=1 Tax=Devosia submarina TaxID=1173082 RepID=UPI001473FFAA|nr:TadE/TadG family type IV pilus assembly protein [Devosia submarina]
MRRFFELVVRFRRDEGGAFAVIFGVMAIVLVALSGAVVDYVALQQARSRAQIALDAAVLALQPEINERGVTEESLRQRAEAIVIDRIGDSRIAAKVDRSSIDLETGRLFFSGEFTMPTMFVSLVGVNELKSAFSAEAIQGSVNLEVSLSLDVTGSMGGSRIRDLKVAAKDLVDVILQNNRGEISAKIALVPYSQAVNGGKYATALRGPIRAGKPISDINWASGSSKPISALSNSSPVKVTSSRHGFKNGEWVFISNVSGFNFGHVNNSAFQVQNVSTDTFTLSGTSAVWYASYYGSGTVVKCLRPNCTPQVTSNQHGFKNNDYVAFSDVQGMTGLNGNAFLVSDVTANTLILNGASAGGGGSYVAGTGKMHCTWQNASEGCGFLVYPTQARTQNIAEVTNCVTERAGPNALNDQPPTTTLVGRNYPPDRDCPSSAIIPLTDRKADLVKAIDELPATGTTAGSLGILWSWYMLSPKFGYVWENAQPAPYGDKETLKVAIIMTDGDFNTVHFDGVLSRDSNIGSSAMRHANIAHNGAPYVQAKAYCDAMRTAKITVYTVGFDIGNGTPAANIMAYCATEPANYYAAENGDELKEAFQQIARNISALRLTQ